MGETIQRRFETALIDPIRAPEEDVKLQIIVSLVPGLSLQNPAFSAPIPAAEQYCFKFIRRKKGGQFRPNLFANSRQLLLQPCTAINREPFCGKKRRNVF